MQSSEKIINNSKILELIFLYLDIEEHLKLIKICPKFEDAILQGVWCLMYKNLKIAELSPNDICLFNAVNKFPTEYSPETIRQILKYISMYVQKMTLYGISCLENIIAFNYHQLTELIMRDTIVDDTLLHQVATNCLNLQSFSLKNLLRSRKKSNFRPNVFGEMKALNKLEISCRHFDAWNYFDVQQLFCLANLKTLSINIKIADSNDNKLSNNSSSSTDGVYNIEDLTIGILFHSQSIFFEKDLIRFKNLTKLSIASKEGELFVLNDNVLTAINNACPKLCELSFHEYFLKFKNFPRMNNLKHLTFALCWNVGLENFDEIFRKLKLKSLSLIGVQMRDEAENISNYNYTTDTLEALTIEDIFNEIIVRTFFNQQHKFEKVSKVTILKNCALLSESTQLRFSHNFPNLQELIMNSFYISLEDILHLEHLKVLEFSMFANMPRSYLEILFKHPTLTHITITNSDVHVFEKDDVHLPECCESLTTTLEYLSLPTVVYEKGLDFWPSFRQRNKLLKLKINDRDALAPPMQ